MLNLHQIERLLDDGQYRQLVDRILANGRATDPSLRPALTQQAVLVPVALGLALQRACELSYGPNELTERIVVRLLDLQLSDGRFGSERSNPRETIIASAIALRAMLDYQQQQAFFRPLSPRDRVGVRVSCPLSLASGGERVGVRVPPDTKPAAAPTRPAQSSSLTTHPSNQSLAAAVERTVGALAAAVAGEVAALHAASSEVEAHRDDPLPLRIVAWQLRPHRAAAMRVKMPQITVAHLGASSTARAGHGPSPRKALAA